MRAARAGRRRTRTAKQFLTFAGGTPFQHAGAVALRLGDDVYAALARELRAKRDHLCDGLAAAGLDGPAARRHLLRQRRRRPRRQRRSAASWSSARASSRSLRAVFYDDADAGRTLVRFAFCKRPEVIDEAARRLAAAAA